MYPIFHSIHESNHFIDLNEVEFVNLFDVFFFIPDSDQIYAQSIHQLF